MRSGRYFFKSIRFAGILALLLLFVFVSCACADGEAGGSVLTWTLNNGVLTISGRGPMSNYDSSNPPPWESKQQEIESVVIGEGVTSVGSFTFRFYDKLTSITLPNGLETIGEYAFQGCNRLTSVSIPDSVTSIKTSAFENCGFTEITLPSGLTELGDNSFCNALITTITIPSGITRIEFGVFQNSHLQKVYLPASVTAVGQYAFSNNDYLTEVEYSGTMAQAQAIKFEGINDRMINALWICSDGNLEGLGATSGTCGEGLAWELEDGTLMISGQGAMTDYDSSNPPPWESKKQEIESVEIGEGVTSVGSFTFRFYDKLTSITLPNGLETIGQYAFQGCNRLTSVSIPDSVTSIKTSAFENCGFTEITLPSGLTELGDNSFCNALITTITIPSGITRIEFGVFQNSHLQKIYLPASVTTVGQYAFSNNDYLTEVEYSGTMAQAQAIEFEGLNDRIVNALWICSDGNLEGLGATSGTCGEGLTWELEDGTLMISGQGTMTDYDSSNPPPWESKKQEIESVEIAEGVTSVGSFTFRFYDKLTSITLPNGLETIGQYAFQGCNRLTSVSIPDSVTSIKTSAFENCGFTEITLPSGLTELGDNSFCNALITTITIPSGITRIEFGVFQNSYLQKVYLPASVTEVGQYAFSNNYYLTEVQYSGTMAQAQAIKFEGLNNYLVNALWKCRNGNVQGLGATSGTCGSNVTWDLSGGKLSISGEGELAEFTELNPAPWTAFREDITALEISEGVTAISDSAFAGMPQLSSLTLPLTIERIGDSVFYGCSALADVYYAGSEEMAKMQMSIGNGNEYLVQAHWHYRMDNEGNLEGAVYWEMNGTALRIYGDGRMPDYNTSFAVPWHASMGRITSVTIEDGVKNIGSYLFYGATALTEVNIASSVTSIGEYAFNGCTALESITIPQTVTSIGVYAFNGCTNLGGVTLPQGRVSIGSYAFYNCKGLTGITLPGTMTRIPDGMLRNTGLTGITIPAKVKTIGEYAFAGCNALAEVSLPEGIDTIEYYAFNSTAVSTVTFAGERADAACIGLGKGNDRLTTASWQCSDGTGAYPQAQSGMLTTGLTWALDSNGMLTVSGSGAIPGYADELAPPWYYLRSKVTKIAIGERVRSIGEDAFRGMTEATELSLAEGLTTIRGYAFQGCSKLAMVTPGLPGSMLYIENTAFNNCPVKNTLEWAWDNEGDPNAESAENPAGSVQWTLSGGVLTISGRGMMADGERPWYSERESITAIEIQDGITGIWEGAFRYCTNVTSVTIPNSVSHIGYAAFYGCGNNITVYFGGTEEAARRLAIGLNNKPLVNATWQWAGYTGSYPAENGGILSPDFEWRLDFNGTLIVSGEGAMPDCNGSFHAPWNKYASQIRHIVIEEGVKTIGAYAFTDFTKLGDVSIPGSVTSIGEGAFRDSGMPEITIPDTVVKIGENAFQSCDRLTTIHLGNGITKIPWGMCQNSNALQRITIPDGVNKIEWNAFWYCRNLEEISLPGGLRVIEGDAFYYCNKLTNVTFRGTEEAAAGMRIGAGNEKLTGAAWSFAEGSGTVYPAVMGGQLTETISWSVSGETLNITGSGQMPSYSEEKPAPWLNLSGSIKTINVGSGITNIGAYAFHEMRKVTEVTLAGTIRRIGAYSFRYMNSLTEIEIPDSVTSIGEYAFETSGLTRIEIPDSVTRMGWGTFSNCTSMTSATLGAGLTGVNENLFWNCTKLADIVIPDGVTYIGSNAFRYNYKLANVSLPETVTMIDYDAFENTIVTDVTFRGTAEKAATIAIGSGNGRLTSAQWHFADESSGAYPAAASGALTGNILWNIENGTLTISGRGAMPVFGERTTVPWQPRAGSITKVVIGEGIRSAGSSAFRNLTALTEVEMAGTVTSIGSYAFYGDTNLKQFTIPVNVTTIGEHAFQYSGLENISIPESVTAIGYGAFENCNALTDVTLTAGITRIPEYGFWNCTKLERIVIPEGITAIGSGAFGACYKLAYVELPASMMFIEYEAFTSDSKLKNVRYRDTEDAAFYLEIDSGNAYLLDAEWRYKIANPIDGMTKVLRLPAGVKVIEDNAFERIGAEAVVIPDGAEVIGEKAFANSSALVYVQVPESVTSIAGDAFYNSNVKIICEEGGTIAQWAQEHEIETVRVD